MTLSGSMPRTLLVLASSLLFLAHFLLILVPRAPLEEDAFITCRFAENVAAGKGFVFNEGERVEGFSNPSLVMMLAAAVTAGLPAPQTAQAIGLLSVILLFVYLGASAGAERLPSDRLARLATMPLVATCFPFVFWAHQGLETALFATLLTVASFELMRGTPIGHWLGGWLFALAIWTRPEAPLVALAATAAVW